MTNSAISFETLFLISIGAGLVGALSGMGGGVVLIPVLTYLGMDIKHAIALSIVSVIATSSGSASAYVRDRLTNLKIGMFLELFTILGAFAGAAITLVVARRPLFIIFGVVLLAAAGALFSRRNESCRTVKHQDAISHWLEMEGSYFRLATGRVEPYQATRAWLGGPLMLVAGLLAGLLGIGAGAFKVLIMDLVMGLPTKVSTTTSNLIIGVTALAGSSVYLATGLIEPGLAAPVVLGIVIGAFLGTQVLVRTRSATLQYFFMAILLLLGAEMIWRGVRGGL